MLLNCLFSRLCKLHAKLSYICYKSKYADENNPNHRELHLSYYLKILKLKKRQSTIKVSISVVLHRLLTSHQCSDRVL